MFEKFAEDVAAAVTEKLAVNLKLNPKVTGVNPTRGAQDNFVLKQINKFLSRPDLHMPSPGLPEGAKWLKPPADPTTSMMTDLPGRIDKLISRTKSKGADSQFIEQLQALRDQAEAKYMGTPRESFGTAGVYRKAVSPIRSATNRMKSQLHHAPVDAPELVNMVSSAANAAGMRGIQFLHKINPEMNPEKVDNISNLIEGLNGLSSRLFK